MNILKVFFSLKKYLIKDFPSCAMKSLVCFPLEVFLDRGDILIMLPPVERSIGLSFLFLCCQFYKYVVDTSSITGKNMPEMRKKTDRKGNLVEKIP